MSIEITSDRVGDDVVLQEVASVRRLRDSLHRNLEIYRWRAGTIEKIATGGRVEGIPEGERCEWIDPLVIAHTENLPAAWRDEAVACVTEDGRRTWMATIEGQASAGTIDVAGRSLSVIRADLRIDSRTLRSKGGWKRSEIRQAFLIEPRLGLIVSFEAGSILPTEANAWNTRWALADLIPDVLPR